MIWNMLTKNTVIHHYFLSQMNWLCDWPPIHIVVIINYISNMILTSRFLWLIIDYLDMTMFLLSLTDNYCNLENCSWTYCCYCHYSFNYNYDYDDHYEHLTISIHCLAILCIVIVLITRASNPPTRSMTETQTQPFWPGPASTRPFWTSSKFLTL